MSGSANAQQSRLPACPPNQNVRWNNCLGIITFPSGEKYVGEFRDDKRSGQGTNTFPDGLKYVGEYKDGKRSGQGTFTLPDGAKYVGEFKDGKQNGQGTFTLPDGHKYVGEFKDGKFSGQGTFTFPDGHKYVGEFKDGKFSGKGTYTFPDGAKYVGEFRDDKRSGQGILYAANGSVLQMGVWADNKFVRSANVTRPEVHPPASKASSGSAFRIAKGQFVTNHHVINGCTALKIDGNIGARVLASDAIKDLALVSISNDTGESAKIRTTRPLLNEGVTVAGYPLNGIFSGLAVTNGTISRLSGLKGDTGELQISAPVQPGNSGGPLLDSAGNVIGVISSKLDTIKMANAIDDITQNINFAVAGNALRGFLDAKGVNYNEAGNEREITGVQVAARASAFTVLIECAR